MSHPVAGAGVGLRRAFLHSFLEEMDRAPQSAPDFLEVAPENWIGIGGRKQQALAAIAERFPLVCHGLSLSIAGPDPLDMDLLSQVRTFCQRYGIQHYTEHLSYCAADGHLYDLMPVPFTREAVAHVAARVRQVQDFLGERIALENISYYAAPNAEMSELEFLLAVLQEADCDLLLDVNNIYVNAINHRYDARTFLYALPAERIRYVHVAGHYDEAPDLKIDTHGSDVKDDVWHLLADTYRHFGVLPTLLERDFNIPPLPVLLKEVGRVRDLMQAADAASGAAAWRSPA